MSHEEIELTERDYYLLGMLAEETRYKGRLPHGCTRDQAERLARAGYLGQEEWKAVVPGGQPVTRYYVTEKGRAAWQNYRFIDPRPKPRND
jgi:hypothetical protein